MNDPNRRQDSPPTVKDPGGKPGSYPLQLVVLLVIFAAFLGAYIYLTSGDDETAPGATGATDRIVTEQAARMG